MNIKLIAGYLQYLRKSHGYTQDDLADKLDISRQAVSKWETGTTVPDLEILLKLSKLYNITINGILEPEIPSQKITDFEQISIIPENELKEALQSFDDNSLAIALMGASPETNRYFERVFCDIDFGMIRSRIGPIRLETVEDIQKQMVCAVNLKAVGEMELFDRRFG